MPILNQKVKEFACKYWRPEEEPRGLVSAGVLLSGANLTTP